MNPYLRSVVDKKLRAYGKPLQVSTGALMRDDPMPSGMYFVDVPPDAMAEFEAWRIANGVVILESQEMREGAVFGTGDLKGTRILFDLPPPREAPLPPSAVGFPTIVPEGNDIVDTFDEEKFPVITPEEDPLVRFGDRLGTGLLVVGGAIALLAIAKLAK